MIFKVLLPREEVSKFGRDPDQWFMYEVEDDRFIEAFWPKPTTEQRLIHEYGVYGYAR